MKIPKAISPLLRRGIAFLAYCIAASGIIGPKIISSPILFHDGFGVYGSLGKVALFGAIAFAILLRDRPFAFHLRPWRLPLAGWLAASVICYAVAWAATDRLLAGQRTALQLGLAHGGLLASIAGAALGTIGPKNLAQGFRAYRRELLTAAGFAAVFYAFLLGVYALWQPLAAAVLHVVAALLRLIGLSATIIQPRTLLLDKFGITVAQYCSGIESIALFSCLYAVVGFLDWNRLRRQRFAVAFLVALALLFACNILRIFGLIVAGYYINQQIAFSMFHSYAGMVFFIVYSIAFWAIAYKHLVYPKTTNVPQEDS